MKVQAITRKNIIEDSVILGITYITITIVIFFTSSYFSGSNFYENNSHTSTSNFGIIDITSGLISFIFTAAAVWKFRQNSIIYNISICFIISFIFSIFDFIITSSYYSILYSEVDYRLSVKENIGEMFLCWAVYFGWSGMFLTLLYSFDVRDREGRLAVVREEALSAQMRALRYQVNPHFLFNTLNSIAGLIEEGSATRAERMVLSLSTFLRTTLTLDPFHDVRLSEELTLQEEYLEIEHERFSDRMTFYIDMPDNVGHALVPSLILQPLIENAIKHGVGAMAGKVNISLSARREADRLHVIIENDMPTERMGPKPAGMGVGLKNVADRLRARFQDDGRFSAGPVAPGIYRVTLDMPWRAA